VDIIVLIDKEFGVKVKSEELAKLATLADLYAFIQAKTE
jgi:acyl carrier protein